MKIKQKWLTFLFISSVASPSLATETFSEKYSDALEMDVQPIGVGPKRDTKVKAPKKARAVLNINVSELDRSVLSELKKPLYRAVVESDACENLEFQSKLKYIRQTAYGVFTGRLAKYGQSGRSEEESKSHFAKIWQLAVNATYDQKNDGLLSAEVLNLGIEEDSADSHLLAISKGKKKPAPIFKTTLFNILLRSKGLEISQKVQTLIENGANKNLVDEFLVSPRMENQSEYPLQIALNEIENSEIQRQVLKVLFNDQVYYGYRDFLEDPQGIEESSIKTSLEIEDNKDYVLGRLLDQQNFSTFNLILTYLERSNTFVISDYEDRISQIEDQIYCPVLEKALEKMRLLRLSAMSSDRHGNLTDNLAEFYRSKHLAGHIHNVNHDSRFGAGFVRRMESDFEALFTHIAENINESRNETELTGAEFKTIAIEWAKWANFRNRIASHLNKYALSASNKSEKSNVIRLIRYTNIYHKNQMNCDDDEIFRELHELGGKDIIFMNRNKFGWTPLMYAMAQKQAEGIQLYLRQAPHEITLSDGVDNNLVHLAFPLPEQYFRIESNEQVENVLQLVGADVGKKDALEKTDESIRAILTERSLAKKDKVSVLKQLSASNFTPVSLAAAMGFIDIYEYLVDFLKGEGEWNRDDHSHLDTHVEELLVFGMKNFLAAKGDGLTLEERIRYEALIDKKEQEIKHLLETSVHEVYDSESASARQMMALIRDPAAKILESYGEQKGTKRSRAPYATALKAAFVQMLNPQPEMVEVYEIAETQHEIPREVPVYQKEKPSKGIFKSLLNKLKSKKAQVPETKIVYETVTRKERVKKEDYRESVLSGMKTARSIVKSSYLTPLVKYVTSQYLSHHSSPKMLTFDVVYRGLSENETKDFFKEYFNDTIERRMQEVIKDVLRDADRLCEDDLEQTNTRNRFDDLDQQQVSRSHIFGFGSDESESASNDRNGDDSDSDVI